jgi:hypothetical protein
MSTPHRLSLVNCDSVAAVFAGFDAGAGPGIPFVVAGHFIEETEIREPIQMPIQRETDNQKTGPCIRQTESTLLIWRSESYPLSQFDSTGQEISRIEIPTPKTTRALSGEKFLWKA